MGFQQLSGISDTHAIKVGRLRLSWMIERPISEIPAFRLEKMLELLQFENFSHCEWSIGRRLGHTGLDRKTSGERSERGLLGRPLSARNAPILPLL